MIDFGKISKAYFVGIKGSGMVALLEIFMMKNIEVTGSDTAEKFYTDEILRNKLCVKYHEDFDEKNISPNIDLIVYSTAYNEENNPEIRAAKKLGIRMISYPEALGELFNQKYGIAVCGTHGKTTTTALLATVMKNAGLDPTAVVGSQVKAWRGSALVGRSDFFIIEADEYQDKFRYYHPQSAILTSADWDHPDYFKTYEKYKETFVNFLTKIPRHGFLVTCADRSETLEIAHRVKARIITYGFSHEANFQIKNYTIKNKKQYFEIIRNDKKLMDFELQIPGKHNVLNATAAIAMSFQFRANIHKVKSAIADFKGTSRRFEYIGRFNEAILIDDYGHHPEEIKATLSAARSIYPKKKIWCVFQPHTFSRTQALLSEFAQSFNDSDEVIILDIYGSAREKEGAVHAMDLVREIRKYHHNVHYLGSVDEAVNFLSVAVNGNSLVISVGAGNVWKVVDRLNRLEKAAKLDLKNS